MFHFLTTVRIRKIVGRSHCPGAKITIFMNTIMTSVTQHNTVIGTTHPAVVGIAWLSQLIWHYMMSMIININKTSTTMGAFIPLTEKSFLFNVLVKIKWSGHIKFLLSGSAFFNYGW